MKNEGSPEAALVRAARTAANRRVVVAFIDGSATRWWGGSIDDWQPDESRLSSRAALERYLGLVEAFRAGQAPTAHALMAYRDGTFASVMLGVSAPDAIESYLREATEVARTRSAASWLKA